MLRRRNRRREGWEKSKRVTGQREHRHAWEGKWERTKRRGTEEGLHIRHAEEETEIKRRERGGEKKKRQIHRIFQERRRQESRTRMTGRREGIKQGISIFA